MKNNNNKYMPKTPKEKGLMVGALVCVGVFVPSFAFIVMGISIIPFLIIALLAIGGVLAFALYSRKLIDAGLKEEGSVEEQPKVEEPVKAKEPEPVKEEPAPVQPVEKKKPNKAVFAVIIPIVAVALVAAIAIPVTIHFVNANNNTETDNGGGNNNNNGGSKISFNITSTTRYEETSTDRVDGYQFEPNKDFIEYRFILSDAGWYVEWIDYGKWSFDASTGYVSAVCTTYETFNVNSQWITKTYSEGALNAQKSLKVINDTTLYWNGNSNFVAKKVSNFTHPIVILQERP